MQSLEELLNGSGAAPKANSEPLAAESQQPAPPDEEIDPPAPEANATATGVTEETPSQAAPPAAPVDEPLDKKISAFQRKAEDETRKRQDYERKLADAEQAIKERDAYIERVRQSQAQQPAAQPEIDLLDPQQAQTFIANQLKPQLYETRVLLSQEMYRAAKTDYDEMETIFADQCDKDPALSVALFNHPIPAKFAYEEGKKLKLMQEISDPDAYRAKMREEIMAELQAQQSQAAPAAQVPTMSKPVPQPPTSLAGVPSAARNVNKQPWKGPTPLDQLLN